MDESDPLPLTTEAAAEIERKLIALLMWLWKIQGKRRKIIRLD